MTTGKHNHFRKTNKKNRHLVLVESNQPRKEKQKCKKEYLCPACEMVFPKMEILQEHFSETHIDREQYSEICYIVKLKTKIEFDNYIDVLNPKASKKSWTGSGFYIDNALYDKMIPIKEEILQLQTKANILNEKLFTLCKLIMSSKGKS